MSYSQTFLFGIYPYIALTIFLLGSLVHMAARAAHEAAQPQLTIEFHHEVLTRGVLALFPDGLPFDRTGNPTDAKQAEEFWQLLADWPISVAGEVTDLRALDGPGIRAASDHRPLAATVRLAPR